MIASEPVIEVADLTKAYKSVTAVDELTFSVPRGSVVGFLGPNGAGKTTTLRILLGSVRPDRGTVRIMGHDVSAATRATNRRIGALIETPAFYPTHTGRTNLRIHARLTRVGEPRIGDVLDAVGLSGRADSKVKTYSLGMKQRLGIASALLTDPELLVLDEPTNGLDPAGMVEIRQMIRNVCAAGRTVFVSSHLLAEAEQMCDYVIVINRGRLVSQGPIAELVAGDGAVAVATLEGEFARSLLTSAGYAVHARDGEWLEVTGARDGAEVDRILCAGGIYASQVVERTRKLEEVFLELTGDRVQASAGDEDG